MRVVSNSGPIIHLSWIDQLNLLRELFEEVLIPPAVERELRRGRTDVLGAATIHSALAEGWLHVQQAGNQSAVNALVPGIDPGEAEAIVVAQELVGHAVIDW